MKLHILSSAKVLFISFTSQPSFIHLRILSYIIKRHWLAFNFPRARRNKMSQFFNQTEPGWRQIMNNAPDTSPVSRAGSVKAYQGLLPGPAILDIFWLSLSPQLLAPEGGSANRERCGPLYSHVSKSSQRLSKIRKSRYRLRRFRCRPQERAVWASKKTSETPLYISLHELG